MILSKTPFRISFAGGGTDYFNKDAEEPGRVITTTINKYMYVFCNKRFDSNCRISYSETEIRKNSSQIKHEIIREGLKFCKINNGIEICTVADIPSSGSGLASSSALAVGLLNAINFYKGIKVSKKKLAEDASFLERTKCRKPIGMQDQYATAYGGFNKIKFFSNKVEIKKINISHKTISEFKNYLLLFYTGISRQADKILGKIERSGKKYSNFNLLSLMAKDFEKALLTKDYKTCGEILNESWRIKKSLNSKVSSLNLDNIYSKAIKAGAYGGKILGAGGGGFFLFIANPNDHQKIKIVLRNFEHIDFDFTGEGSKVLKI